MVMINDDDVDHGDILPGHYHDDNIVEIANDEDIVAGQYHDSHIAILLRSLMIMETLW